MDSGNNSQQMRLRAGGKISAGRFNHLAATVERLDNPGINLGPRGPVIEWVRLTQAIGPSSNFTNRTATLQWFNPTTNKFQDTSPAETVAVASDPLQKQFFPIGAIIPVECHWSGLYFPLGQNIPNILAKYTPGGSGPSILTPGTAGTFTIWNGAPPTSESSTSILITATARFEPVDVTGYSWLSWNGNGGGWYVVESEHHALLIGGTTSASLSSGGTILCGVGYYHNGSSPAGASGVMVKDADGAFGPYPIASGTQYRAHLNRTDGKYYFDWLKC